MTNARQVAQESGTRPKGPTVNRAPKKKAPSNKDPKTVKDAEDRLRRLGTYPMVVSGPYDADDYDALTRRRLDWTTERKRLLMLKHELGRKTDNEATSLRGTVTLTDEDNRKNATRVKQSEAWRYKQLDGVQRQAELELERVMRATRGGPSLVANYGRVGGGNDPYAISAAMEQAYSAWRATAVSRGVLIEAVLTCIIEPVTMAEIERAHGIAAGDGIRNHCNGLNVWAEIRGWVKPKEENRHATS